MTKTKTFKKILPEVLSFVLIVAMALTLTCCGVQENSPTNVTKAEVMTEVGTGTKTFDLDITDKDGNVRKFKVNTDAKTVGDALLELNLISGDDSGGSFYVKKVNGITADYDKDKTYWAFYENGKYASKGVDTTEIVNGAKYGFKVEK